MRKLITLTFFIFFAFLISYADTTDTIKKLTTTDVLKREKTIEKKSTIDYISIIANIATALGFIIASLALYREIRTNTVQKLNEQADSYRQTLESINQEIQSLHKLLRDGSPLIYGAHEIAKEFSERLKGKPQQLINDKAESNGLVISSCVIGWYKSPLTSKLSTITDNLRRSKAKLNGVTKIFVELIDMLDVMIDDSYSPTIFSTLLTHKDLVSLDKIEKENPDTFVSLLSNELHGNTAQYFLIRYFKSIEQIKEFIEVSTFALANLDDSSLVKLCRLELPPPAEARTKTIKGILELTKNVIKKQEQDKLYSILGDIEISITKESAYQELHKDK
jgi:hypothetical protein